MSNQYCDIKKLVTDTKAGRWWDKIEHKKRGEDIWKVMKHNGVLFPDPYKPLPNNIKVKYKNKPVSLNKNNTNNPFNVTAEEAAVFFAMKMEQDNRIKRAHKNINTKDPVFRKNFWNDWKVILGSNHPIKSLKDVDFQPVVDYIVKRSEEKKAARKGRSKEEKAEEKEIKEERKQLYGYALVDGIRIPIGGYVVQPPGLFMGHGKHPKRGKIKRRMEPKDITINVSKKYVPKCFSHGKPCQWGDVQENRKSTMIAFWKNPVSGAKSYVNLSRTDNKWVCMDDIKKFEKARNLNKNINKVRRQYRSDMRKNKKEFALATYFLDILAIRPGSEQDKTKQAGTLGLTTLKCDNISFLKDNKIKISFKGKSSILFDQTIEVIPFAYKLLQNQCKNKSDSIFPGVTEKTLNSYLEEMLPGLTSKVFRTRKASNILQNFLDKANPDIFMKSTEKKIVYNDVNVEAALALNHKRMADNSEKLVKIQMKIREYRKKLETEKLSKSQKERIERSIKTQEGKLRETEKNVATSTSKVNYNDPRITVAWAKRVQMPIEKLYNKTQLQKFVWAMETPADWRF